MGLSAPSTSEWVNRLEEQGIITGYQAKINPVPLGYSLEAIVRVKPMAGALHRVEQMIQLMPESVACDEVTGEDCCVMRLQLRSIQHLDEALDPLTLYAQSNSALVKSTPVKCRTIKLCGFRVMVCW
ncbi:MAG: Lrp/AsnC family transcriptional regulator [Neisseriaceae bacterium]|nr:Lrp/AsnC family transcriptional regulator [Neisseriaceae bacterium]